LKESPDFGYSRFNDRDKELSSVKFNIRSGPKNVDHQSFIIEAINENNEIGKMVLSFIFSSSSMNVLRSEIVKEWKGTGLGQMLYDKAIDLAKSKGCREFRSDTTRSYDADQAWEKLRKRYPVRYRDSHTYIPHSYFYIVLSRIKVAESPDFGYRHYNDRDAEISKLTWKVKSDENGIEIRAIDKNNISGFSEGVIIARPMKSDSCGDISCIELNGIQITTSKLTERGNWHNTGLGQMLYDRMIHEAKKAGYSYIVSDFTRSLYAKSAWEKLAKRYSVKKLKDSDGDSYFRIDLQGK
jgi:GNAT superfamily N-acetyltransferase